MAQLRLLRLIAIVLLVVVAALAFFTDQEDVGLRELVGLLAAALAAWAASYWP